MFTPVKLGNTTLPPEVLKADKKSCKRYGPCGVGEQALYLNSFFIDRRYYVALESVRRVFKRVAMSKGGFTGKGAFGSIPYLVVELDNGSQKQCNFKHEEDVDLLLAHMARVCPDIPRHSVEAERRLREKAEREAKRYLKQLTPQAQAARETLEQGPSSCWRSTRSRRRSCPRRLRPSGSMTAAIPPIAGWRWLLLWRASPPWCTALWP